MPDTHAYKILTEAEYAALQKDGQFSGSAVDHADGYIHLSFAAQLQGTLDKHYRSGAPLRLVEVELADCDDPVKHEVSRGGADFPHLYGILKSSAMRRVWPLAAGAEGRYSLPADLQIDP